MLKLIKQGNNTKTCGQCTTAMLLGITIEESIKLYGHETTSNMREAKKVIEKFNFKAGNIVKIDNRKKWNLPKMAFVRVCITTKRVGHFIAYKDGVFYDPSRGIFNSKEELLANYNNGNSRKWRFSHYMEVVEHNKDELTMASGGGE